MTQPKNYIILVQLKLSKRCPTKEKQFVESCTFGTTVHLYIWFAGNRLYQKEICRSFDEISETALLPTTTTEELINQVEFIQNTEAKVFPELELKLKEAENNVLFLLGFVQVISQEFGRY